MPQTIRGLTAATTFARNSVVPIAPTSGADLKANGQQIVNMIQKGSVSTHNTTSTLNATDIVGGIIRSTPSSDITLTFPDAIDIYNAIGSSPGIGTYVDCLIENFSLFNISFSKTDTNLLITGLVSTFLPSNQTFYLRFSVTNLSPIQITIDGGQNLGSINNISKLIVVSKNGSDSTGNGSFFNPYLTVNNALSNAVIGSSTIFITPGLYTENVVLLPSVGILGCGNQLSVINGTTTIDRAIWDATLNAHLDIESIGFSGTADFSAGFGPTYVTSSIKIKNSSLPDGSTFQSTSSIQIIENTIASNISITTPSSVLIQSPLITGTLTFTEGLTMSSPFLIKIDSSSIDTINCITNMDSFGIPPITITNCSNFGSGTLILNDTSAAGWTFLFSLDATSYPSTITKVQGTETFSPTYLTKAVGDIASLSLNNVFTGNNTFSAVNVLEVSNPFVSNKTPVNITATTATLTDIQFVGGVITLNPILAQTLTTPTASQINTILNSPATNRGFLIKFVNQSSVATTLVGGTNVSTAGCYLTTGSVIIPALSQRDFVVVKTTSTPAYTIFG